MQQQPDELSTINARLLRKPLYVIFSRALKPMSELAPLLLDHLNYMIDIEQRGILFASGPFLGADHTPNGNGMTIVRASSVEAATAIAREDPFNKHGLRTFEIIEWQLNEGSYTVTLNYSDQSYRIS